MIMAERNQNDVKQFKEVFPEGTNITDELIIWWARDRASFPSIPSNKEEMDSDPGCSRRKTGLGLVQRGSF